mmetsp:Transcript_229/g.319  ORF Transcript_229/g.319 Transcript_229/m.319 type:complete len:526 (-) Transcript_229:23-1600(-)|eukprot:CAMPEP_0197317862 /NCGR_PEP_ID=MMETSP0891-20130614/48889_1 /TAXON_ID=44058 ORGANISM="Aureoumbra lagunensis, Strain CCMP1510" /NCGR_SAMPLE_ID=MMETSP0891 /ASSEMBLY_ACC=CAM_ASM_000534 /LENGTH=525 /DNA_ID=CAMNT_0042808059 /DNA_START=108 /DNA_END=1685 /DNA_ORIENTATION=-
MMRRSILLSKLTTGRGKKCLYRSKHYGLWINGQEVQTELCEAILNPATGKSSGKTRSMASLRHVDDAVAAAKNCFQSQEYSALGSRDRAHLLRKIAISLRNALPELVKIESECTGRPVREFKAQLARVPEWFEYHASLTEVQEGQLLPFSDATDHIATVRRKPLGVCALITPFNHPLLIASKKIAVALATGNTCVIKPSELAPASVLQLAQIATDVGFPDGALNVVTGGPEAALKLAQHDEVAFLDFTGGNVAGRLLASAVAQRGKSYCLETGGNAPVIIFDDVHLDNAVNTVTFAAFVASGQTCVSAKRIIVHHSLFESFKSKLVAKVQSLKIADPSLESTHIGPLISHKAKDSVAAAVEKALHFSQCTLLVGGFAEPPSNHLLKDGFWFQPTVLAFDSAHSAINNPAFVEEIFGPVVTLTPFSTDQEALDLANSNRYALGASILTSDLNRAHRLLPHLNAGIVWANTHHRNSPDAPWGGFGDSGVGRENGLEAHHHYTQPVTFINRISDTPEDWFSSQPARYG